jgi:1-acyl-sn-glycerol-3-phosphate acyltransferase
MHDIEHTPERLIVPKPRRYRTATRLTRVLSKPLGGIEASGTENLPPSDKPYILAANHRSSADCFIVGSALQEHNGDYIHFLAARKLWDLEPKIGPLNLSLGKYMGKFMSSCGAIPITQNDTPSSEVLRNIEHVIENNGILGIFPEGGVRHGNFVRLERGVGYLAALHGLTVLPVGIAGSEFRPEEGKRDFGNFHVHFGEAMDVEVSSRPATVGRVSVVPELRRHIQSAYDTANNLRAQSIS